MEPPAPPKPKPPQQIPLPDCSIGKTRRRSGKPLRRTRDTTTLVIPNMPEEISAILKRLAKRRGMTYTALCREILRDHAYLALNPGRRPR